RSAHAAQVLRANAVLIDVAIGEANGRRQPVLFFRQLGVEVERPSDVLGGRPDEEVGDRFGSELARHVTGTMAPHSIRYDEELVLRNNGEAVLVVFPLGTNVTQAGGVCAHSSKYSLGF